MTNTVSDSVFLPVNTPINEVLVWQWYLAMSDELDIIDFTEPEKDKIKEYYREAGLFQTWRRNFFRRHYSHSFTEAANYLVGGDRANGHILDLGCGTGAQAMFFALRGAKVTGVDMDEEALDIFRKRITFYEDQTGQKLDITLISGNCFDINYKELGEINGVYSMFAFNMMQPSDKLMKSVIEGLADNARFVVLDGNNSSWLPKLVSSRRRDVWSPEDFSQVLKDFNFTIDDHKGAVSLPPVIWNIGVSKLKSIDAALNKKWLFALSHQIMAEYHNI